jgi:hypothetical protein
MLRWLGAILGIAVLAAAFAFWFVCPCARVPGGALSGEVATVPVTDWSFVNGVPLCQLQVNRGIPWSINLNCMSDGGALYVSCSRCAGKVWSQAALDDPQGYLRAGAVVYPVTMTRLVDPAALDVAWSARVRKLGLEPDAPRPDHWWSFELESPSP